MPRARALAAVALPLAALAACSNRPNDLYTYYDDPTTGTSTSSTPTTTAAPVTTTTSAKPQPEQVVALGVLRASDLVAEEVTGDPSAPRVTALPDCGIDLGTGPSRQGAWTYPSGAKLRQVVLYAEDATEFVETVRAGLDCTTFKVGGTTFQVDKAVPLPALPGTDAKFAWCATGTAKSSCTVALAAGPLATVVTVEASTATRAKAAITRVSPTAAAALSRGA
ncbi:hypothetical protein JOD54_005308 [Actinokineospora baliensis]|uniref:hypothetical protein n=1 Tax=Actinokineospora baliensis TaxID=547056 RepID=UPI00195C4990|nr:hypothetical protein [Actinokineospora baliensis]MBM7775104.1 hypothetical protein [Actinokineospora baliensis]